MKEPIDERACEHHPVDALPIPSSRLEEHVAGLADVGGVVGVVLGGSRARGDAMPGSDVDLGLYYRPPLDVAALRRVAGPTVEVTEPGGWGPWVDGGAWLHLDGTAVDWIFRDADRVAACVVSAREGRYAYHAQPGHPLGVPDFAYAAELATGVLLADPTGELAALQDRTRPYPPALADALQAGLWEAQFCCDIARKALSRSDTAYVAQCLSRAVLLAAHAVCGRSGVWVTNEKGLVTLAGRTPGAPPGLADDVVAALGGLGTTPLTLGAAVDAVESIVRRCA